MFQRTDCQLQEDFYTVRMYQEHLSKQIKESPEWRLESVKKKQLNEKAKP